MNIDEVLSALEDWLEAKTELAERQAEYTGYSPSWALASWIEAEEKAKKRIAESLEEIINEAVEKRLAGERRSQ